MRLQIIEFFFAELEHEVGGKPINMSLHVPDKNSSLHFIEPGEVRVHHDLMATNQIDLLLNGLKRDKLAVRF